MKSTSSHSRYRSQEGLNLFELMWFMLIVAGAVFGAFFGFSWFGLWGAVLGIPAGGAVGYGGAVLCAFLLALIFKALWGGTVFPPRTPLHGDKLKDTNR